MSVDFFQLTAERVHNVPQGWKWFAFNSYRKPEDFFELKGAVPVGVITRGPRKGMPKWPKEHQVIWMRRREVQRVSEEWEQENGKCYKCEGTGQEFASVSVSEGTKTRKCSRCDGTGSPTTEAKAAPCKP